MMAGEGGKKDAPQIIPKYRRAHSVAPELLRLPSFTNAQHLKLLHFIRQEV
jgi:hypothetical protein